MWVKFDETETVETVRLRSFLAFSRILDARWLNLDNICFASEADEQTYADNRQTDGALTSKRSNIGEAVIFSDGQTSGLAANLTNISLFAFLQAKSVTVAYIFWTGCHISQFYLHSRIVTCYSRQRQVSVKIIFDKSSAPYCCSR